MPNNELETMLSKEFDRQVGVAPQATVDEG
jgi:hypothetical protein